jgi:catechol 2,3-dioxygenase-like lactoylglutathione lyase family enzyme
MPITRMDHFTVLTKDANATAQFYSSILGMEIGPRPNLKVRGVWLYCAGAPLLHVIEKDDIPTGTGVLDHVAFCGTDLAGLIAKLEAGNVAYELNRFPPGGPSPGDWQLFFRDPNGARVEVDLPASEPDPQSTI